MHESEFSKLMVDAALHASGSRWDDVLECLLRAETLARGLFGVDDPRLAKALHAKAKCLTEVGRVTEARQASAEASIIDLGESRRSGQSLSRRHRYKEAEKEYLEALRICISAPALGPEHRETATCLDNLATCLRSQCRYVEAMAHCRKAMEIRVAVLGEEHGHTAQSYSNLGFLLSIVGQHADGERLLVKSLDVRRQVYGPRHHYVAESKDRLASLYRTLGKFEDALPLAEDALSIRRTELGSEHPLCAASLHNVALIRERRPDRIEASTPMADDSGTAPRKVSSPGKPHVEEPTVRGRFMLILSLALVAIVVVAGSLIALAPVAAVALTALVVLMMAGMSLVDYVEIKSLEHLGLESLRRRIISMSAPVEVDRDRIVLGGRLANGNASTANLSRKPHLEVKEAIEFIGFKTDPLDLDFVHSLTLAAADQLAKHRGTLKLNGLGDLPSKLARSLRWHEGRLELNGVHELTEAAAAHISRHGGELALNGLREIPQFVARHLAHHRGTLELNGVRALSEDAAGWMIKHRGEVLLRDCRTSYETTRILRTHPQIEFPDRVA